MEIPSKDICAQVHFALENYFYRSVIMEENLTSPKISAHKGGRVSF